MAPQDVSIRRESRADSAAIADVTVAAFATLEISNQTEHLIVDALREAGALSLSLVAEREGGLVGHIAFSPVTMTDGSAGWYGLGPVSVHPDFQRMGIGKALIEEGLAGLKESGAKGCCLVGHPDYYPRFGFVNSDDLVFVGVPPEAFFVLAFDGSVPNGAVEFHEAFLLDG